MEKSKRRARAIAIAKTDDANRLQVRFLTVAAAISLAVVFAVAALRLI